MRVLFCDCVGIGREELVEEPADLVLGGGGFGEGVGWVFVGVAFYGFVVVGELEGAVVEGVGGGEGAGEGLGEGVEVLLRIEDVVDDKDAGRGKTGVAVV